MIFSSIFFLMFFLPLVLGLYYVVHPKLRNTVLLISSLVFYAWGEPVYICLMIASILFNYLCGLFAAGRKSVIAVAVTGNLAGLIFFKYTNFFIGTYNTIFSADTAFLKIVLPIGISFYTFQAMSYVIDVYRGDVKPQKNIISFGTYIALFPQLIAGPIVRYKTIDEQLSDREVTVNGLMTGIFRFVTGLAKKVLIANNIGLLWETVSSSPEISVFSAWLGIIAFALQIYFDFSGYSDMAIGLGRMFGFEFENNFNYPYTATSVTDFWRRWHISLSTWFKQYVYIPLGGNRVSHFRRRINLFIVWSLTGLWHGASFNFLVWGIYYAVILILEKDVYGKYLNRLSDFVCNIYTLFVVMIGWVFFANESMWDVFRYLGSMFGIGASGLIDKAFVYYLTSNVVMIIIGIVASVPFAGLSIRNLCAKRPVLMIIPCLFIFVLCLAYLADASYNPFLYFRF